MEYRKKLRIRLIIAVCYIVLGLALALTFTFAEPSNSFFSGFGFAFVGVGIARVMQYFKITKNEDTINKQRIAESDERNIAISTKAGHTAFWVSAFCMTLAIVLLEIFKYGEMATALGFVMCVMLVIYFISYFIIRKRS